MEDVFKNFSLVIKNGLVQIDLSQYLKRIALENNGDLGDVIRDAEDIGGEFLKAICGYFPDNSLFYSFFSDGAEFPWIEDTLENQEGLIQEIEIIARRQFSDEMNWGEWVDSIYEGENGNRWVVNEMAVSGLGTLDFFLRDISTGYTLRAVSRAVSMYRDLARLHAFVRVKVLSETSDLQSEDVVKKARRDLARNAAMERLKRDPKQKEKLFVRECWDKWQENPDSYKSKTAFSKDMLSKYETLENQNVIVRWCGAWEKENSTQLAE